MQDNLTDVCCMTSAVEALASYLKNDYCLIILDTQLSDINSMELLRTIRNTKHTPILTLTESLSIEDKTSLIRAGADACIEKPVNLDICVAQANSLIQLYIAADINYGEHNPVIHGEELIISPRYRRVTVEGTTLELTRNEFDLLYFMAGHSEQIFSCEQLYEQVWTDGAAVVVDDIVKSQIKRLRKKLALMGKDYIQNERGVGYKFVPFKRKA